MTKKDHMTAKYYFNRGSKCFAKKQYVKAIENYTQAICMESDYTAAYAARGDAYSNLKQYDNAIADYTQVIILTPAFIIPLMPHFADIFLKRGNAYYHKGQYNDAQNDFEQVLQLNPNHITARKNLDIAREKNQEQQAHEKTNFNQLNQDHNSQNKENKNFAQAALQNPNDDNARHNLEIAKTMPREQRSNSNSSSNSQPILGGAAI